MKVIKSVLWRNKIAGSNTSKRWNGCCSSRRSWHSGCTVFSGVESFGADGRRHSARFFELADQPMEMVMAVTEEQANRLFERIAAMDTKIFYIKTPIEYGQLGKQENG